MADTKVFDALVEEYSELIHRDKPGKAVIKTILELCRIHGYREGLDKSNEIIDNALKSTRKDDTNVNA